MRRAAAWAIHEVIVEKFIASFKTAPEELVLDFDATDDPLYGKQESRFFHGYYARCGPLRSRAPGSRGGIRVGALCRANLQQCATARRHGPRSARPT